MSTEKAIEIMKKYSGNVKASTEKRGRKNVTVIYANVYMSPGDNAAVNELGFFEVEPRVWSDETPEKETVIKKNKPSNEPTTDTPEASES